MNDVRLVQENGVPNIQKKLWYADDNSEINLANFEAGDRIYSINDDELYQVEYDTSTEQEYSGEIVSFEADEDDRISSLEVEINPVQDLHGQTNPYPAGGGKNKNPGALYDATIFTARPDGTVLVNGTATTTRNYYFINNMVSKENAIKLPAGTYTASYTVLSGTFPTSGGFGFFYWEGASETRQAAQAGLSVAQVSHTFTDDVYIIPLIYVTANTVANNAVVGFQIESGSSKTDYAPYENECPISGWTGLNIEHTSKNLFNQQDFLKANGWVKENGKYIGNSDQLELIFKQQNGGLNIPFKNNTQYTISFNSSVVEGTNGNARFVIEYTDGSTNTVAFLAVDESRVSVTSKNGYTIKIIYFIYGSGRTLNIWDFCVCEGINDIYSPYQGETIQVSWQTEAGTVYGGSDKIVSGELTSTMGMVDMGDLTWTYYTGGENPIFTAVVSDIKHFDTAVLPELLSSIYKTVIARARSTFAKNALNGEITTTVDGTTIFVRNDRYSDAATFKAAMSGVQLCYKLAQPVVYQLGPVIINLLLGQNNIWADTGDTTIKLITNSKALFTLNPHS